MKIKEAAGMVGGGILALVIFSGVIIFLIFGIEVIIWLATNVLPWLSLVMWLVFLIDLILFIPLGLFQKTKGVSAIGMMISSYIYGSTLWLWSVIIVYEIWGTTIMIIGLIFMGVGVVPMAFIAVIFNGEWYVLLSLVLLSVFTMGSQFIGYHILKNYEKEKYIETDYIEV